jgi:hypothetical protein
LIGREEQVSARLAGHIIIRLPHRIGAVIGTGVDGLKPASIINIQYAVHRQIEAAGFIILRAVNTETLPGRTKGNK